MIKKKFYLMVSIALLCCNLILVFFLLQGPKINRNEGPMRRQPNPKMVIIEKLHFDDNQVKAYEQLIDVHQNEIQQHDRAINDLKRQLYLQLKSANQETKSEELIAKMCEIQSEIERAHFQHFFEIRALCRPDQIDDFDSLSEELARILGKPPLVR